MSRLRIHFCRDGRQIKSTNMKYNRNKTHVVIADDHDIILTGIRTILRSSSEYHISAEAKTPTELMVALSRVQCDILITDFNMPDALTKDGLSMLSNIRMRYPDLPIIVLSTLDNPIVLSAILGLNVMGVVSKGNAIETLPKALLKASLNEKYLDASFFDLLVKAGLAKGKHITIFTKPEIVVFNKLTESHILEEIKRDTGLPLVEIISIVNKALRKFRLKSIEELTAHLSGHGFYKYS